MGRNEQRKPRPPLDGERLNALALAYVGRFATTRARLRSYLTRKIRERGWTGPPADVETMAERFAALGYIDDAAYALSKSRSLAGRGYGPRRLDQSLRAAGVEEGDAAPARDQARADAAQSALHFARRRRLGPFASEVADRNARQRGLAAMIRAGHDFALARAIIDLPPGADVDAAELAGSGR